MKYRDAFTKGFAESLGKSVVQIPILIFLWWIFGAPSLETMIEAITRGISGVLCLNQ